MLVAVLADSRDTQAVHQAVSSADEPEISRIKRDHRCVHTYLHHDPTIKIVTTNIPPREHRQGPPPCVRHKNPRNIESRVLFKEFPFDSLNV